MGSRSSGENLHAEGVRWFLPSVADLIFVAMLGLLVFTALSIRLLGDAGIGWHIRTGQLILAMHAVPHVDPFSSSMAGRPWFAWEWLYDLLVGWLERVAGLNGVVLFTALIIGGVFSWTFRLLVQRGTNVLLALILVLLAASASMIHFLARPHVVSWLFTVLYVWILESSEENSRLWLLPPLMLVWVNVHGGFLVGFALLAIYWIAAAWLWLRFSQWPTEDRFEEVLRRIRAGRRVRILARTGILSAAVTLINPYGYKLHPSYLSLSFEPFPNGSHRRVSVSEFSLRGAEMFCRIIAFNSGRAGREAMRDQREPGTGSFVRSLFGTLRLAEHSRVVATVDSGDWALVVEFDREACGITQSDNSESEDAHPAHSSHACRRSS